MSWEDQEEIREQKERLRRELERRRENGETLTPFEAPKGTKLTKNFWGGAWCRHLETYAHHAFRLPRGRTRLRRGDVYNLAVRAGLASAEVAGDRLYEAQVRVEPLPDEIWEELKRKCQGEVGNLLDLLAGKFGDGVMRAVTDPERGLFPRPDEIRPSCDCPDDADLCEHAAAVLYATGVLFDRDPGLLFEWRGVDPSELIRSSTRTLTESVAETGMDDAEMSALFGIDLAPEEPGDSPEAKAEEGR